jgi:hypothetical protein
MRLSQREVVKNANASHVYCKYFTSLFVLSYRHLLMQATIVDVEHGFQIPCWINLFQACTIYHKAVNEYDI